MASRLGVESDILTVKRHLSESERTWLLIMDNADDPSLGISNYFPTGGHGTIIINTQAPDLQLHATVGSSNVGPLSRPEGVALLSKSIGIDFNRGNAAAEERATTLVDIFGGHPLALSHAAAYVKNEQVTIEDFIKSYQVKRNDLGVSINSLDYLVATLLRTLESLGTERSRDALDTFYFLNILSSPVSAARIFELIWNHNKDGPKGAGFDGKSQLRLLYNPTNGDWQPRQLQEALRLLESFSLVMVEMRETVSIHLLVQSFIRSHLGSDRLLAYSNATASALSSLLRINLEAETYSFREEVRSHLSSFLSFSKEHLPVGADAIDIADSLMVFSSTVRDSGQHNEALQFEARVLEIREKSLGQEHPDTLRSMSRTSHLLQLCGRPEEAFAMDGKVYQVRQRLLGSEHPETIESMESLANCAIILEKFHEAMSLLEKAIHARQRLYGEAFHTISYDMSQLATCCRKLGRHQEALDMERKILAQTEAYLGREHPETMTRMNNLAVTFSEMGKHEQAAKLHESVLSVSKRILGDEHPMSVSAMHNLATSYVQIGRLQNAIHLEMQALNLQNNHFAADHPRVQQSKLTLATAYEMIGKHQDCSALRLELAQTSEQTYGRDHPATLLCLLELATSKENAGQYEEAIALREKTVKQMQDTLGTTHPHTRKAVSDLATSYEITARNDSAARLRESLASLPQGELLAERAKPSRSILENSQSIYMGDDVGNVSSDDDSVQSEKTMFSKGVSASTRTLGDPNGLKASERVAQMFENDLQLMFAYEDLGLVFGRPEFCQKHKKILSAYLKELKPSTTEQRQALDFLDRSRQRTLITEEIYDRTSINTTLAQAAKGHASGATRFTRLRLPNESAELNDPPPFEKVDNSGSTSEEHKNDDSDEEGHDVQDSPIEISASHFDSLTRLLTTGTAFSNYKQSLIELVDRKCSPMILVSIAQMGHVDAVRGFLERHFDAIAREDFEWLQELNSLGYGFSEMAEILVDDITKSPWIYFDQPVSPKADICLDFHFPGCVHQGLRTFNAAPRLVLDAMEHPDTVRRVIAENCGLAGVAPKNRKPETWTGNASFLDGSQYTALVTYGTLATRHGLVLSVCDALQRFCGVISYLQKRSLCCHNFTLLRHSYVEAIPVIELRQVPFRIASDLLIVLQLLSNNWESPGLLSRCLSRLSELASEIICIVCDSSHPHTSKPIEFKGCIDEVALAVQILTLGIQLYSQAHSGTLQPSCLSKPLSHVYLLGTGSLQSGVLQAHLEVTACRLTCMSGVVGDIVFVFGPVHGPRAHLTADTAYDLVALPEDLAATWDASGFVMDPASPYGKHIFAIEIGNGLVAPTSDKLLNHGYSKIGYTQLHWSERGTPIDFQKSFSLGQKSIVGTVTVNRSCPVDEHLSWLCANVAMMTLGAKESFWERSEAQIGMQLGQYAVAQFNMTWIKRPGTTLKHIHLKSDINLPFLQSDWGLQISYCTGVARRVSLCELLADVTPLLMEELLQKPANWSILHTNHHFIDALRGANFRGWFDNLASDLQNDVLRIVRYVLLILQDTGIDQSGDYLVAIWPRAGNALGCFKIPCKDATYWARMLRDSPDCATFAYVTSICLETPNCPCQKLETAFWHNRSVTLNTAVSRHVSGIATADPWALRHEQSYLIGQPGSYLIGKVSKLISPTAPQTPAQLDISKSKIPVSVQARTKERLREKQFTDAPAHGVMVLTKNPHPFSLGLR